MPDEEIYIGTVLEYNLKVELPLYRIPTWERDIDIPQGLQEIGESTIRLRKIGLQTWTWHFTWMLQPTTTGEMKSAKAEIGFTSSRTGKTPRLEADLPTIKVASLIQGKRRASIVSAPLLGVGAPAPPAWLYWLGMGALSAMLGAVLLYILFQHNENNVGGDSQQSLSPQALDIVYQQLQDLEEDISSVPGDIFFLKLTDCVREYIENRFQLKAAEQTTREFLADIQDSNTLTDEQEIQLEKFLSSADLVKFARARATQEQMLEALEEARRFIDQTRGEYTE